MIHHVLVLYLLKGLPVGAIAREVRQTRAAVRSILRNAGIIIRPTSSGHIKGRDQVCESVRRAGYDSFHAFARTNSLVPVTRQAELLRITDRPLARIYAVYRTLLSDLCASDLALPTPQDGVAS